MAKGKDATQIVEAEPKSHGDEKNVKYFKDIRSSATISARSSISASSKRISKRSSSGPSSGNSAKFIHAKRFFGKVLDAHEEGELTFVRFEHDFAAGTYTVTAHSKRDDT